MAPSDNSQDGGTTVEAGFERETFRLRSYQAEMVEESLRANIIVAMDTGSGKTHIALSRTAAALETCRPDQLVWFLAPTVTLCEQQSKVFETNLPAYGSIVLSGEDNVDHWSDQAVWDAVFSNVRVVISTHQVLLDALTHAFLKLSRLALLIFDEAHHCVSNHPANCIMRDFYIPHFKEYGDVNLPRVLGLSASPVMKARGSSKDLQMIEANMNSIARSPKIHRSELLRFVHKPELLQVPYGSLSKNTTSLPLFLALRDAYIKYDIWTDPYVVGLLQKQRQGYDCTKQLNKVIVKRNTYCSEQLKKLVDKAEAMIEELGSSPTDWYLRQCIFKFDNMIRNLDQHQELVNWSVHEKSHLQKILRSLPITEADSRRTLSLDSVSAKFNALVNVLHSEAGPEFTGLVFVEQRAWVTTLCEMLAIHPRSKDLSIGTFVGTSNSTKRKANIGDLAEPRNQKETLDDFRKGKKNLILATSVLEEGIDISSCHLVICFERPKNLKSFIQRRGRARKQKSKYIIFIPRNDPNVRSPQLWESLEEEMKKAYLDDLRAVKAAEEKELQDEHEILYYRVSSTGALLTSDNALSHLHHFCSLLGSGPYVDTRPQFTFDEEKDGKISARVLLPISVNPAVRTSESGSSWQTERMAKNDAAFVAYKALHLAELVNDNLLPHHQGQDEEAAGFHIPDHTPSLVEVSPPFDPWITVAYQQQQHPKTYHRVLLEVTAVGDEPLYMILLTPCPMPEIPAVLLNWSKAKQYLVKSSSLPVVVLSDEELLNLRTITRKILYSMFHGRMKEERYDFLWLLVPSNADSSLWEHNSLQHWNTLTDGFKSGLELSRLEQHTPGQWGLVSVQDDRRKYILERIDHDGLGSSLTGHSGPQLQVTRATKRRDFLHPVIEDEQTNEAYARSEWLDAADCTISNLPVAYSIFALFAPSILHRFEVYMMADAVRSTILKPVSFDVSHLPLLVRAMTSSSTGEEDNYQRLEFLGDCILKFISSVHLMATHLNWHENLLTGKKGKVVCNGFLARATMAAGLDKFINTKRFTGSKWSPRYANDILNPKPPDSNTSLPKPPTRSSKLLADLIESFIGASYVVGGMDKAFVCMQTLLPLEPWTSILEVNALLFDSARTEFEPTNFNTLERLIGYSWSKKSVLLEALTHVSYVGPHAEVCSYERHEFLGDAILDYIVSKRLFNHYPELSHQKMHAIRTAMVNAAFLAFRMFETTISEERIDKSNFRTMNFKQTRHLDMKKLKTVKEPRALWQFLRLGSLTCPQIIISRDAALKNHAESRAQIIHALQHDKRFPWHLLSLNDAPKFLSDIVESVIGAIYVDSHGSIPACEIFVRRLGIFDCLERILRDEVDCLHPKERLGHLAVEKEVRYVKLNVKKTSEQSRQDEEDNRGDRESQEENEEPTYKCQVRVGGEDIGEPVEGLKKLNAETIAAWRAVSIMEGRNDVKMSYGNSCEQEEEDEEWYDAEDGGGVPLDAQ